ncbi:MAG TPA: acetate kinase [Ktedonobacteraceae bacterium]|jgi:acetate kinase|nr:acetate kinase [Ktedonobacteraceae bacterium]
MKILVLNAGSSSQKSRLYELGNAPPEAAQKPLWQADADWGHTVGKTELRIRTASGVESEETLATDKRPEVIQQMLQSLWSGKTQVLNSAEEIDMVGHRVVHGGEEFEESTLVTPQVKEAIKRLAVLAPAHNPANLEGIQVIDRILPDVPQVAVFDTAFHRAMPLPAVVYPGPYSWFEQGIRRFGFHGISHQYCSQRAAQILDKDPSELRLITCHLGNGCSLAAILKGKSIETTMGFTPLEGLMMGSRSGSVDPGILLYLLRQKETTPERLDTTLNKESGLKGIAGASDMRQVLQDARDGKELAKLALDMYIHRLRYYIGAMLATLGGVDALVFAGGVGENSPEIRAEACAAFGFLGLQLDPEKNRQSPADTDIASADSKVRVLIVHTEEDWEIARECWKLAERR